MRLGHHFYLMLFSAWKHHQNVPGWLISPFNVPVERVIMSRASLFCVFEHGYTPPLNEVLLGICLPVRSASWIQPASNVPHPQPLRAHPPLQCAQHTGKAKSRFLARSTARERAVVNERAHETGVDWAGVSDGAQSSDRVGHLDIPSAGPLHTVVATVWDQTPLTSVCLCWVCFSSVEWIGESPLRMDASAMTHFTLSTRARVCLVC